MIEEIRRELRESADPKYKEFHQSLVPGLDSMLGVRIPRHREIGKRLGKSGWEEYLREASDSSYEELMLQGLVIGYGKMDRERRVQCLEQFIPKINNWAICDCSCSTYHFMRKEPDFWFTFLEKWLSGGREYEIRFGVVCLLDHFVNQEYLERVLKICDSIRHDGYYVKMAVAWALSVCCAHFPEQTKRYLENNSLDDFTLNKTIQKCRESYRISKEDKEYLLKLKRGDV